MTLQLGNSITMPDEAITETFGILAARGAGKSNTAAVMAEEMFAAHLPFVAIDPVGSWWGLRSSSSGTGPGLDIPLFGGKRGDVTLERTGGRLVADIVVEQRLSCVLDLTEFDSEASKKHFLLDFARRLYQKNEAPLHLFLEEADDYIPQRPMRDEAQLLRAWENIVRRGRARGLGMTMITQRSASINKNVLTQVQTLIAMRTTGPQDRKAIEEWVKYNDQSRDILETLSSLGDGEAWIWSPQFLKTTARVQFRRRRTFDSGSTPKMAAKGRTARLADVDVGKLREQMADTIKRAEAEDPKILKRRLAELERDLKIASTAAASDEVLQLRLRIADMAEEMEVLRKQNDQAVEQLVAADDVFRRGLDAAVQLCEILQTADFKSPVDRLPALTTVAKIREKYSETIPAARPASAPRPVQTSTRPLGTNGKLGKGEAKVLTAIAQHEEGVDREQVTVLTGYKRSTRDAYIQRLVGAGLVDVGPPIRATDEGIAALGPEFEPLPTGAELREYWLQKLPSGERAVLEAVIGTYPSPLDRDTISDVTSYKRSTRDAYIQRLRTRQLVTVTGAGVAASEKLF